ncbi:MAG: hypothetical protein KKE86_12190 [Planctomycetes bacterium]|nr:hypothetical protein [Planctomycetota bacterium]MBU4400082.1 hypothetical protein [Planctomycetota bacterium]MCG2684748.1 hypothetical protein [Planctomycetales bacterium]
MKPALNVHALPQALGAEPFETERLAGELQKSLGGQNLSALGRKAEVRPRT